MKRFANRTIGVDQGTVTLFSDFDSGGDMWTGTGPRERRTIVDFEVPFKSVPAVYVTLSMLDADRKHNQRMDLGTSDVTESQFTVVFRTWGDTRIARARAAWMAIGELKGDDEWEV